MRRVLLFILILLALGVIFLLASPVYYGKQAQFFINRAVASANQNYGKFGVHASINHYERHWYTSTAVIDIAVDNVKFKQFYKQYVDPTFNLKNALVYKEVVTVLHGPVLYRSMGNNPFSAAYVKGYIEPPADFNQRLALKAPLVVFNGRISYTGVFAGHVAVPALYYTSSRLSLRWNGLSFFGNVSSDLSHVAGHYTVQPATIDLRNVQDHMNLKVILSPINTQFDFQRTPMGLWTGYTQGNIQDEKIITTSIKNFKARRKMVEYHNISTRLNIALQNNEYSFAYHVKMARYKGLTLAYAQNINVDLELDNLNALVMQSIQALILHHLSVGDLQAGHATLGQIVDLLPKLITQKTQIKLNDVSFDLPKGRVALQGEFSWPQYEAGMPLFTMGIMTHASMHISVGKILLDQLIVKINQEAKEAAVKKQATAATTLPALEPGPVILPAKQPITGVSAAPKPAVSTKTTPAAVPSVVSPYMDELGEADGFLKYCLAQGYVVEKDQMYQTQLNYTAGNLIANGKKVKL